MSTHYMFSQEGRRWAFDASREFLAKYNLRFVSENYIAVVGAAEDRLEIETMTDRDGTRKICGAYTYAGRHTRVYILTPLLADNLAFLIPDHCDDYHDFGMMDELNADIESDNISLIEIDGAKYYGFRGVPMPDERLRDKIASTLCFERDSEAPDITPWEDGIKISDTPINIKNMSSFSGELEAELDDELPDPGQDQD